MTDPIHGLFLLDKPAGVTSYDCVHVAKRVLQPTRAGHCGTLDPSARGLLIILLGQSTRWQDRFHLFDKEYRFRAQLGVKTDTADRDGQTLQTFAYEHITRSALEAAAMRFTGTILQTPPRYSALKFKGKPYHLYARKGIEIPRVPRPVDILSFQITAFEPPFWEGTVVCSRGTYIRTLIEDVAESLGSGACLAELSRERIGPYRRDQATSWESLRTAPRESLRESIHSTMIETSAAHV